MNLGLKNLLDIVSSKRITADLEPTSLPGMVASEVALPVIGVPVRASVLDGMDSLLSIVQMPRGIPCATVRTLNCISLFF